MKIKKPTLESIAVKPEQYPDEELQEIAIAGRSNVGKSSFINTIVNRKMLAKTGNTPGKTRTINFYNMDDIYRIVDLPGYGYAKVSKSERERWAKMIEGYLLNRKNLKEVILLVDIRHEPTQLDYMMYEFILNKGFRGYVVATKADKISRGKYQKNINVIKKRLKIKDEELIIPFSSFNKFNKEKIITLFDEIVA